MPALNCPVMLCRLVDVDPESLNISMLTLATRGHCLIKCLNTFIDLMTSDYHSAQPETVTCLTGHPSLQSCGAHVRELNSDGKKKKKCSSLCQDLSAARFNMSEEIWAHLSSRRSGPYHVGCEIAQVPMRKRGTNKRLSEKSSHRSTVDCQRWFEAGALLLPADKPTFLRSAEPLGLCTRLAEGKRGGSGCSNIP